MSTRTQIENARKSGTLRKHAGGSAVNRRAITESNMGTKVGAYLPENAPDSAREYVEFIRSTLRSAGASLDGTYSSTKLTLEGKREQAKARAMKAMQALDDSAGAKLAFNEVRERFTNLTAVLNAERKPPATPHEVAVAQSIRDHFRNMKPGERKRFAYENRGNPDVVRAVLTAPAFLFGMSDDEVRDFEVAAQRALHPEEFAAREMLEQTAAELERSTRNAYTLLAEAAELRRARDGETWLSADEADTTLSPERQAALAGDDD